MFNIIIKFIREKILLLLIIAFLFILGRGIYMYGYDFLFGFSDNHPTVAVNKNVGSGSSAANTQTYNSLSILIQLFSLTSIILVISQVKMMNDQSRMNMSYELYKENTEIRQLHGQARKQLKELESNCSTAGVCVTRTGFDEFYADEKYKDIRRMAYHFEYIGYLVKSHKVHFNLIFDPITFPDWLIEGSVMLRERARTVFPDFWEGTEFLYNEYQKARMESSRKRTGKEKDSGFFKSAWTTVKEFVENFGKPDTEKLKSRILREIKLNKEKIKQLDGEPKEARGNIKKAKIKNQKELQKMFLMYARYKSMDYLDMTESKLWNEFIEDFKPLTNAESSNKHIAEKHIAKKHIAGKQIEKSIQQKSI